MKALTLWQPWASLIAWGEKQYETRAWATTHRGLLAIHASVNRVKWEGCNVNSFYQEALDAHHLDFDELPLGKVLCIVRLVDCCPTDNVTRKALPGFRISPKEENFGDYSSGRYAWKMELVEVFEQPIPALGHQRLWEWPEAMQYYPAYQRAVKWLAEHPEVK